MAGCKTFRILLASGGNRLRSGVTCGVNWLRSGVTSSGNRLRYGATCVANWHSGLAALRVLMLGLLLATGLPILSVAQIRIIPSAELLEASSPRLCADSSALSFDRKKVELNNIAEDSDPVDIRFRVKNVSGRSISVERLSSSCSCVSLSMEKTRLAPAEETVLLATYNPEGHPGQFLRKIFIYTEASDRQPAAILEIRAHVSWTGAGGGEYPYSAGTLLLRRKSLTLKEGTTESVRCFNPSDKPLKIGADLSFVPLPLRFECIPPVLAPESEGRLVFSLPDLTPEDITSLVRSGSASGTGSATGAGSSSGIGSATGASPDTLGTYPVILKGCEGRPIDSTVKITIIHS